MNRQQAREIAYEMFPIDLYGSHYETYKALRRDDPIACDDLLDHIQYNEPMN